MSVLVDTSVWIDYFRGGDSSRRLDFFIDENLVLTNDLILAELVPFLKVKKQHRVVDLLHGINKLPLDINWEEIIKWIASVFPAVSAAGKINSR